MQQAGLFKPLFFFRLLLLCKKKTLHFCADRIAATISICAKKFILSIVAIFITAIAFGQSNRADSVALLLASNRRDTSIVWLLKKFSSYYVETRADTALLLAQKGLTIARKIHFSDGEIELLKKMAGAYNTAGDFVSALEALLKALDIAKSKKDEEQIADCFHKLGLIFRDVGIYNQSLSFFFQEKEVLKKEAPSESNVWNAIDIAEVYAELKQFDSTRFFLNEAYKAGQYFYKENFPGDFLTSIGDLNLKLGNDELALRYFRQNIYEKGNSPIRNISGSTLGMAKVFQKKGESDSAVYYAKLSLTLSQQYELPLSTLLCATFLSDFYKKERNTDSAYVYMKLAGDISYQLFNSQKIKNFHDIYFSHWMREQEVADRVAHSRQRFRFYLSIAGMLLLMGLIVLIIYFKTREKRFRLQQALLLEQKQKEQKMLELQHEKSELEMQVLRTQMNPHFIFNVLNSINHFILTHEAEAASDYLVKFARLMRMILSIAHKNTISLQQELECLDLYIQMEQLRFENRFHYFIHCDTAIKTEHVYIPPLLLQPFVENAIWHGLMHKKEEGGKLSIEIIQQGQMLICTITDNGIGRQQAAALKSKAASDKKSMGIQITANRLHKLHGETNNEVFLKVIDLKDETGAGIGTKVIIQVPIKTRDNITV